MIVRSAKYLAGSRARIEALSIPEPNSGCWLWLGSTKPNGYGNFYFAGRFTQAHRASYMSFVGTIPHGMVILHRCDNPACVNPAHLAPGSQSDNLQDCVRKGRHRPFSSKGEVNNKAKLTAAQIAEIRAIPRTMGALSLAAPKYGVTRETLCAIRNGRSWKHLP